MFKEELMSKVITKEKVILEKVLHETKNATKGMLVMVFGKKISDNTKGGDLHD